MRYNRKKHFLLLELQKKDQSNRGKMAANFSGLTFEKMENLLKINRNELELLLAELLNSKEIGLFDINNEKGCFIDEEIGFLAISKKKYLRKNEDIIISWFKVFTQIIIPILSLTIAVIVLSLKFESITNNIERKLNIKQKKELKQIELKLDSIIQLENNRKNNPNVLKNKNE